MLRPLGVTQSIQTKALKGREFARRNIPGCIHNCVALHTYVYIHVIVFTKALKNYVCVLQLITNHVTQSLTNFKDVRKSRL